jgi:glycosyltransferase involved in cell wall biosynthesis
MNKHIGIDARLAGPKNAGIGRYIDELLFELFKIKSDYTWTVFLSDKTQLPWITADSGIQRIYTPTKHYTVREQVQMPIAFLKQKLDLLHVPHFNCPILYPKKTVLTIHDLLWHTHRDAHATTLPPLIHAFKHKAYLSATTLVIRKADGVIVPSQEVARDVQKYTGRTACDVIYEGVPRAYLAKIAAPKKKNALLYPYIFSMGSLYPHKNFKILFDILEQMPKLHVVMTTARSAFSDQFLCEIAKHGLQKRFHLHFGLSDEQVIHHLQDAIAFVFPSLSEGFGLPGVEAMSVGCPVISSDIPIFREVYKNASLFAESQNAVSYVTQIQNLIESSGQRAALVENGRKIAAAYRWKKAAEQTVQVYNRLCSE